MVTEPLLPQACGGGGARGEFAAGFVAKVGGLALRPRTPGHEFGGNLSDFFTQMTADINWIEHLRQENGGLEADLVRVLRAGYGKIRV